MKTLICMFMVLATAFSARESLAQVRIPVAQATTQTQALGLETFRGQQIQMRQIVSPRTRNVPALMSGHQIELNTGDIVYPQEIQFVIIEGRPPREYELRKALILDPELDRLPREHE